MTEETLRRGLSNQGGFFSPYYLFDLLARRHRDELDLPGRDTNRRLLRPVFRRAWARLANGSTPGEAWQHWYRELFTALGFIGSDGVALRRMSEPVPTPRHGRVPISHAVYLGHTEGHDEQPKGQASSQPLLFVDLHGFGTDLDRDLYPEAGLPTQDGDEVTREPIVRAVEFALDHNEARWALVSNGQELRLYRKGSAVARQYLRVDFPALFDADRDDEWTAFWGLFRRDAFLPAADGRCFLDRVLEESHRHATRIADDLRENVLEALEALIQGALDDRENRALWGGGLPDEGTLGRLFEEGLYFLYRLLFVFYAESRDLLPVSISPIYRDAYSLEHLRELVERELPAEDADKTYVQETLHTLFRLMREGFPPPGWPRETAPFIIPPFDGDLFDPARTALLDRCRIPDRAMHRVVRALSLSRPGQRGERRERYSYADLGVDQLGSIYEGLLVYEPAIATEELVLAQVRGEWQWMPVAEAEARGLAVDRESLKRRGEFYLRLWGGRRKGTGSYYTPQEITSFLVRQALEPLVRPILEGCAQRDRRGRPKRRAEEILELEVCDPAMGSGAFLIQACRYLAEAYGQALIAEGRDVSGRIEAEELARYKRLVAERCLYGVDLNPLAVELAKVSLWLETLAVEKPLSFLDHRLRCGNSLIGAPLTDKEGKLSVEAISAIPDQALRLADPEATPQEQERARAQIRRNRSEYKRLVRSREGEPGLWDRLNARQLDAILLDALQQRAKLDRSDVDLSPQEALELRTQKAELFRALYTGAESALRRAREICDLWCAVWFWPALSFPSLSGTHLSQVRAREDEGEAPTTAPYRELVAYLLGQPEDCSLGEEEREAYLETARRVAGEQRFFHWELEFPEVFRRGGFDAIVGNPPWETVKPNSKEFWSNYDPFFRDLGKQVALRRVAELRERNPEADRTWRRYIRTVEQTSRWLRESGLYSHQGRGDLNTYKLFLERAYRLLRPGGTLSFVVPSGLYTDEGTAELRRLFFEQATVRCLVSVENRKGIFPIDSRFKFVFFAVERGGPSPAVPCAFFIGKDAQGRDRAPDLAALRGILSDLEAHLLPLPREAVRRFSPDTLSLMEFKNRREMEIAARIYDDHPLLGEEVAGAWNVRFTCEFHMTNDSHLFRDREWLEAHGCREVYLTGEAVDEASREPRPTMWLGPAGERYLPLYEGKMVHQFDHWYANVAWWIDEDAGQKKRVGKQNDPDEVLPYSAARLGFRGVASSTNERTLISALVPSKVFGEVLLPFVHWLAEPKPTECLFLCSLLNGFVLDFVLRFKVSTRVSNFFVYQLPIPRFTRGHPHFDALVVRAARLTCTTPEFADLWEEMARQYPEVMPTPWRPEVAATDPRERAALRAEIDALVADLYGLSEEDFAYILTTFPLLDRDQPPLRGEPKSFITRDQALLALFRLRGKRPPEDIVAFFAAAGADISAITGPVRGLEERVHLAWKLGAVAYIPSRRGSDKESDLEPEQEMLLGEE